MVLPALPLMCLGAAIGGAIPNVPSWGLAFSQGSVGGVLLEMLSPAGGFGKFVAVILAFSLLGNIAGTMYSITIQFQVLLPVLSRVPRYVFAVLTTAIIIGVSIPISRTLESSLENFLGIISYWSAIFIGIVSTEHLYFRKGDASSYDPAIWDVGSKLPVGVAAICSVFLPFALIVPCMDETWYTGPIAKTTGDIGFEVGFVLSIMCYIPLRTLERRITGR
jgi:purine-cytosine permease-like protein